MLPWQRTVLFLLVAGALVELGMLGASHKRARVRLHPDHPDPVRASAAQAADFAAHARTLGVAGALYVANLPRRTDRRANMSALADHLGADVRFVDAVDARGPEVAHILEHVRALRESGAAYPEKFAFPARSAPLDWTRALPPGTTVNTSVQLYSNNDEANTPTWDGTGQEPTRLREGAIACWETHLRMLRRIAAAAASAPGRGRPSAAASTGIIFEDDIDTEVDIRARLEGLWPALPPAWDMVFLGAPRPPAAPGTPR
jgi:GR25 family glycosyltransferase involved in LPS biosynthesis